MTIEDAAEICDLILFAQACGRLVRPAKTLVDKVRAALKGTDNERRAMLIWD